MPNSATEKLLKILKLEGERGYQDKAVTRGLASFTAAWLADAAKSNIDPTWANSVADEMRAYSAATGTDQRRAALGVLMTQLQTPVLMSSPTRAPQPAPKREQIAPTRPPQQVGNRNTEANADRSQPSFRSPKPVMRDAGAPGIRESASRVKRVEPVGNEEIKLEPPHVEPARMAPGTPVQNPAVTVERSNVRQAPARTTTHDSSMPLRAPQRPARFQAARYADVGLDASVGTLNGVGSKRQELLEKLGIRTIRDLLYNYPTRYDDYSLLKTINQLEYGESVTIIG
ncbi:MAG TPA: hypothetical protein VGK87_02570, partial [Anaerolineae bacterium]